MPLTLQQRCDVDRMMERDPVSGIARGLEYIILDAIRTKTVDRDSLVRTVRDLRDEAARSARED